MRRILLETALVGILLGGCTAQHKGWTYNIKVQHRDGQVQTIEKSLDQYYSEVQFRKHVSGDNEDLVLVLGRYKEIVAYDVSDYSIDIKRN